MKRFWSFLVILFVTIHPIGFISLTGCGSDAAQDISDAPEEEQPEGHEGEFEAGVKEGEDEMKQMEGKGGGQE